MKDFQPNAAPISGAGLTWMFAFGIVLSMFVSINDVQAQWIEEQKILAQLDGEAGDIFGYAVAISGSTAIIGASLDDDQGLYSGAAYIFEYNAGTWTQTDSKTNSLKWNRQ